MSSSSLERLRVKPTEKVVQADMRQVEAIKAGLDVALADAGLGSLEGLIAESGENVQDDFKGTNSNNSKTVKGSKKDDYAAWRANLINSNQSQQDMVLDIQKTLKLKLDTLINRQNKLQQKSLKYVSEYNDVVAQIRNVNNLLDRVAHAGYEALKALWLKIVHGIM